jgi:hypothetical protein
MAALGSAPLAAGALSTADEISRVALSYTGADSRTRLRPRYSAVGAPGGGRRRLSGPRSPYGTSHEMPCAA